MASGPITSWEIDGETVETVSDFIFGGSKITTDGDCSHEIKRHLLLGRNVKTCPAAAAAAKSLQSCPTLCDPIDSRPPGSPSLGFSRQEHWSGLPFPSPGDLPDPGIKPRSPVFQADALTTEPPGKLPRSKRLLISWLQSPSAAILEHPKIKSLFSLFPHLFTIKWWDQMP